MFPKNTWQLSVLQQTNSLLTCISIPISVIIGNTLELRKMGGELDDAVQQNAQLYGQRRCNVDAGRTTCQRTFAGCNIGWRIALSLSRIKNHQQVVIRSIAAAVYIRGINTSVVLNKVLLNLVLAMIITNIKLHGSCNTLSPLGRFYTTKVDKHRP